MAGPRRQTVDLAPSYKVRWRRWLIVAAAFVLLSGLIVIGPTGVPDGGDMGHSAPPPDRSRSKPTDPSSERSQVIPQEAEIKPVIQSLLTLQVSALERPKDAPIAQIYGENGDAAKALENIVHQLRVRDLHYDCGSGAEVLWVEPRQEATNSPMVVQVLAHVRRATCRLLDESGNELHTQAGYERRSFSYRLQSRHGVWFLAAERDLGNV